MAVPIQPEASACSLAKNSMQNLARQHLSEKQPALSGQAKDFERSIA